ncbi:hypothetical protein Dimus_024309 [Dionaea muscipula]
MDLFVSMRCLCLVLVFSAALLLLLQGCFAAAPRKKQIAGSTAVFPVGGRVYPEGYFFVRVNIGESPKPYDLDIDTGSDLTWVQCDAPCVNCPKGPHSLYKSRNNVVQCKDPLCASVQHPPNYPCHDPGDQCDYEIEYADHGLSRGVLVKDKFHIQLLNGTILNPFLSFGCGYDQTVQGSGHNLFVDGVLGLANGKCSILSQLRNIIGVMRNIVGHCFSEKGGGYLFFGDGLVPSTGMVWTPMLQNSPEKHYSIGPAELLYEGKNVVKNGLPLVFDSGSTYTYLNRQAYKATISMIKKNIDTKQMKDAPGDKTLPLCWKGAGPYKSISDVKKFFKPLALRFESSKNTVMEIPPEAYLIISKQGNVCLGILDGFEVDLGNLNVLGGIKRIIELDVEPS